VFNNLTKIVDIVKEEAKRIVDLDTSMVSIYNNFHLIDEKELALQEYIEMLKDRKNTSEIEQVQMFLSDMIYALDKHKVGFIDNFTHSQRIKSMQKQAKNDIKIEVEDDSAPDGDKVEVTTIDTNKSTDVKKK